MIRLIMEHGCARSVPSVPEPLKVVYEWIEDFICRPYEVLGRKGAVCPFVFPSITSHRLFYAISEADGPSADAAMRDAMIAKDIFRPLLRDGDPDDIYDCIVLILPYLSEAEGCAVLKSVHFSLKPAFVSSGLMLGEFHRDLQNRGLHNPDFLSARSPVALLVVRRMVPSDILFLSEEDEPIGRRIEYIRQYLHLLRARLSENQIAYASTILGGLNSVADDVRQAASKRVAR